MLGLQMTIANRWSRRGGRRWVLRLSGRLSLRRSCRSARKLLGGGERDLDGLVVFREKHGVRFSPVITRETINVMLEAPRPWITRPRMTAGRVGPTPLDGVLEIVFVLVGGEKVFTIIHCRWRIERILSPARCVVRRYHSAFQ